MINFRGWFIAVSLSFLIQASLAEESWKADVPKAQKAFEKEMGLPLRAGHHIEPTVFPGYYAIRSGNAGKKASAYFREDMIWMAISGLRGGQSAPLPRAARKVECAG